MRTAAEFFAGIGLVRMAMENAGWSVVFANDISDSKFEMYSQNFSHSEFVLSDIRKIRGFDIPQISVASASFPCIDLSLAGNMSGLDGTHSSAFWEFYRILREMKARKPSIAVLENVHGLLSSNNGKDLRSILKALAKIGYACDVISVDASHFVPQSRPRLFVIGILLPKGARNRKLQFHPARPEKLVKFISANPDLEWNHIVLPPFPKRKSDLADVVERFNASSSVWWSNERHANLYKQMNLRHRLLLESLTKSNKWSFATVYKRVRPSGCQAELRLDGIAGCLRTPRGGSSKQFLIQAGYGQWRVRNVSAREYARLQGVPDSYKITTPFNQSLFGFGDAVCVPAVEWVFTYCVNPFIQDTTSL